MAASRSTRLQRAKQALKDCDIALPVVKTPPVSKSLAKRKKLDPQPIQASTVSLMEFRRMRTALAQPMLQPSEARPLDTIASLRKTRLNGSKLRLPSPRTSCSWSSLVRCQSTPSWPIPQLLCHVWMSWIEDRVLAQRTLAQFGQKKIAANTGDGHTVQTADTSMMSLTVYKHDWVDNWSSITSATYKFFRNVPFLANGLI